MPKIHRNCPLRMAPPGGAGNPRSEIREPIAKPRNSHKRTQRTQSNVPVFGLSVFFAFFAANSAITSRNPKSERERARPRLGEASGAARVGRGGPRLATHLERAPAGAMSRTCPFGARARRTAAEAAALPRVAVPRAAVLG